MELEEFLKQTAANCPKCDNKVKPKLFLERDMGASYNCPTINCGYCDHSTGAYYPNQAQECLDDWNNNKPKTYGNQSH
jgi:predicted RNA-binding Zn-ribbon protein involved in translation (DUF1610 family)